MTQIAGSRAAARPGQSRTAKRLAKSLLSKPEISALVMLIIVVLGFEFYVSNFIYLSEGNLRVLFGIVPELGLVALGVTVLMIAGEFDLSVGSVFALCPMLSVILMGKLGIHPWIAILAGLAVCLVIGWLNGVITLAFNIPSFVTTLGMLFVARSIAVVLSGGFPPPFPSNVPTGVFVAQFTTPGLDVFRASFLWFVAISVLVWLILQRSNFGNWVFATGGQPQAAQDMGIDTRRVKIVCFMLCSFLAGFAGLIQTFRIGSTLPSLGEGLELQAIAAAVIGGASLAGGVGSVLGAVVGSFLIRMIDNGLVMSRVDASWFRLAIGVLTVVAVIINTYIRRRALRIRV